MNRTLLTFCLIIIAFQTLAFAQTNTPALSKAHIKAKLSESPALKSENLGAKNQP